MNDDVENKKSSDIKVDKETAEKEYQRLAKSWKIKESDGDAGSKETVIKAIQAGDVVIKNDKGEGYRLTIVQKLDEHIGERSEIEYKFPKASDMMQMDNFKDHQQFKKSAAMIGSVTGIGVLAHKMGGPDFILGQAIAFVFLGV